MVSSNVTDDACCGSSFFGAQPYPALRMDSSTWPDTSLSPVPPRARREGDHLGEVCPVSMCSNGNGNSRDGMPSPPAAAGRSNPCRRKTSNAGLRHSGPHLAQDVDGLGFEPIQMSIRDDDSSISFQHGTHESSFVSVCPRVKRAAALLSRRYFPTTRSGADILGRADRGGAGFAADRGVAAICRRCTATPRSLMQAQTSPRSSRQSGLNFGMPCAVSHSRSGSFVPGHRLRAAAGRDPGVPSGKSRASGSTLRYGSNACADRRSRKKRSSRVLHIACHRIGVRPNDSISCP